MGRPIRVGTRNRDGSGRGRHHVRNRNLAAAAAALALTATGCVTVHGEREVVPTATEAEAERALTEFTTAYNDRFRTYDPALHADRLAGPLSAVNRAGMTSQRAKSPGGNPNHRALELTDASFSIPKKAGWPRYFLADVDANWDGGRQQDERWLLVFLREGPGEKWRVAYLNTMAPDRVPELKTDGDGFAVPVPVDTTSLVSAPSALAKNYSSFLQSGAPPLFKDGPDTSQWREARRRPSQPGTTTQWIDQPVNSKDSAPLGFATKDGGALVFFTLRSYERQTAAKGVQLSVHPDVKPLMTGEVKKSVTKERVSGLAAHVPAGSGGADGKVDVLDRMSGLTSVKGE
ncbi:hypothetical protein ACH4E8_11820 [Streptomyces sp. NPDC017979]|uniref:hypothetical protein n=1 Tax=Streptomyces sp. NPDC017979 TaxID=3365024 RepID=UPI00378F3EE6